MLNVCLWAVIMVFFAIGIYFTVTEIISLLVHNNIPVHVVVEVNEDADAAENTVRSVLMANPNSEVVVVNQGTSDEVCIILEKLAKDNSRLHIVHEKAPAA